MKRFRRDVTVDVAIVGFGFSGLATLARLPRDLRVAVVASDLSGHGAAYATRDPTHVLNVRAERMGVLGAGDFAEWGGLPAGTYAPRMQYAAYLDTVRATLTADWHEERATRVRPVAGGWAISTPSADITATCCVLALGNEPVFALRDLPGPPVHRGPWQLDESVAGWAQPVALVGSGLSATDSALSLRRHGYTGEIVALSRGGLIPHAHDPEPRAADVDPDSLRTLRDVLDLFRAAGDDWRTALDGLRPHTATVWQRLTDAERCEVVENWTTIWNVHRHRMAPSVAAALQADDGFRVIATSTPEVEIERLRPSAVIDCTGPQLDWSRSTDELRRDLVASGVATQHHTGLGIVAHDQVVAPGLLTLGASLTGQLWECNAVPELRAQSERVAELAAAHVTHRVAA